MSAFLNKKILTIDGFSLTVLMVIVVVAAIIIMKRKG